MEEKKHCFSSVFEGLDIAIDKSNEELNKTIDLNKMLTKELRKSEIFNIVMGIIAVVSLALTIYFGIK